MALRGYLRGEVVEDFADRLISRREALRRLGLLGLGVSGATALLTACGGDGDGDDDARPAMVPSTAPAPPEPGGVRPTSSRIAFPGPAGELQAAFATPAEPAGAVLVIHENRGLTPHFDDLVGRFAEEGYAALCVDLLSAEGGTASLADPAGAPSALAAAPLDRLLGDLRAGIDELERRAPGANVGAVGFCFGGGLTWALLQAGESRLDAAVPFYGPAPDPADFSRATAAVLGVYAERDDRVNASRERAEAALQAAGLTHEIRTFAGADHAFFNDTGPRYNEAAATEANRAVLDWLGRHLAG